MAQQLQTITLGAPGFLGLNTEDSPVNLNQQFATQANNCIIDQFGRLGARKGFDTITTDRSELLISGSDYADITVIHEYRDDIESNDNIMFSAGNNKILSGTTTLVDEIEASSILGSAGTDPYTVTADDWQIVNFNGRCYFFQKGHEPLVYDNSDPDTVELKRITDHSLSSGTPPSGNCVIAAYGRLWVADVEDDTVTVYWSDLYNGLAWSGGTTGSMDVTRVWPDGFDQITALAAHNGFLIIFGRQSIIFYSGASSPATMVLEDTVAGIGCIQRDSVEAIGRDVLFLSTTGLRSLGRTIQEKSVPISDVTNNVRSSFLEDVQTNEEACGCVFSTFSPEEAFYLIGFTGVSTSGTKIYCFDTRSQLEDGSYRVTTWPGAMITAAHRTDDGTLYLGNSVGIGTYSGYQDNGSSYTMSYQSPILTFGDNSTLKILKRLRPVMLGGLNQVATVQWGYGFSGFLNTQAITLGTDQGTPGEYGAAQYNITEYSGGVVLTDEVVNATGSGADIRIGLEVTIDREAFSIQEINVQTLVGRIV